MRRSKSSKKKAENRQQHARDTAAGRVSIFGNKRVGDANDLGNPNYFTPGKYRCRLHRCVFRPSTDPSKPNSQWYIIESMIVDALSTPEDPDIHAEYGKPKRAGELVSHLIDLSKLPELARANVKNFASMLLNSPEAIGRLDDEQAETLMEEDPHTAISEFAPVGDGQLFAGVEYVVNAVASRKRNNDAFTRVSYLTLEAGDVGEEDDEEEEEEAPKRTRKRRKRRR